MKSAEGRMGRVFVLRLEDEDIIPQCIEQFATEKGIAAGHVVLLGGVNKGNVVVGPKSSTEKPPCKMLLPIDEAHEIVASGIIAPDENGMPILHIHGALGRSGHTMTGCLREGVSVWLVCEVIIYEILDADINRVLDKDSGFVLLNIDEQA